MTEPTRATQPLAELLLALFVEHGVDTFVVAPGSRSAPITLAAARNPNIRLRLVYDERSAAYTALGMAQQIGGPVGVICSSGTAALNFAPAVAEAYYQRVPLILLTADRPPEWIDQSDNQAIRQNGLYEPHVRGSFTLPVDDGQAATRWHAARIVADAISLARSFLPGPVHINIPLREPLYRPVQPAIPAGDRLRRAPILSVAEPKTPDFTAQMLAMSWQIQPRKLIIAGQLRLDNRLRAALIEVLADPSVALVADVTSNLGGHDPSRGWEAAIQSRNDGAIGALLPTLAVWIGGQVTSKRIKDMLRQSPPMEFWRVDPERPAADAFQLNTMVIPVEPATFFELLVEHKQAAFAMFGEKYAAAWSRACTSALRTVHSMLDEAPFGELAAAQMLLNALPEDAHLQIGNSMPIRLVNLLGFDEASAPARVDANRGTSGIDGTVSTAVGAAAQMPDHLTTLLVGDLGFFYDRNGLWQSDLPPNLRIVLLNNHGGGIFDVIDGPDTLLEEERREWFLTPQPLTARRTAEDFGIAYIKVSTREEFACALDTFFAPGDRPALIEVETDMAANSATWRKVMAALRAREQG